MKRRTEIDLNRMSQAGQYYYLKDLIEDLTDCLKDLAGEKPSYDYIQACIEHAEQASEDLAVITNNQEEK